ncbi:MAG: type II secretion system protein GspD, partial [Deltaproteobacteria bacterium]|nr:type II secretion system protein GspD [Deltaproteobacteria bacterium]
MKRYFNNLKILICLSVCIFLLPSAGWCEAKTAGAFKKNESSGKNTKPARFISIDFNNVDISLFIKFISELTGKNFVVDRRVRGKVTIISPAKISVKEAYKVFESVLEVHGYTAVKAGEVIKIIPSPDARSKNIETLLKAEAVSPEDKIVTQLIPLKYADPTKIKRLFAPLISKSSVIQAYEPTNMLVVTDVYSNILRLLEIVKAIDVTGIGQEISVIPLEFADVQKLVSVLDTIFRQSKNLKRTGIQKTVKFVADDRTNTIVVLASEVDTQRINDLIKLLDKEVPRGEEKIRVYYLENATAEELAKVLQSLAVKQGSVDKGKKTTPIVSEKVKITADKATNSLIIMAEKDDYLVLEEIIKKLDIPRTMVYIESLIMEVNVEKAYELGIEWSVGEEINIKNSDGVVFGGFSGSNQFPNTNGL